MYVQGMCFSPSGLGKGVRDDTLLSNPFNIHYAPFNI